MTALIRYDAACKALAEARSVDDVKDVRDKAVAMTVYAKQAKNKTLEADATEIRLRAVRRLGEMMKAQRKAQGAREPGTNRGNTRDDDKPASLAEAGIDKNLADAARKSARMSNEQFEETIAARREAIENGKIHNRSTANTGDNEWNTPAEFVDLARRVLGGFDLDPASNEFAQRTVRAAQYFTKEADGLKHEWCGKVWLNPPYARDIIDSFVGKLVDEYKAGRVTEAILLVNNNTETDWFYTAAQACDAICFKNGRIKFEKPDGDYNAPLQGQCFLYFGGNPNLFIEVFDSVGLTFLPSSTRESGYDAEADFAGSIDVAYSAVRERIAAGGRPWIPPTSAGSSEALEPTPF